MRAIASWALLKYFAAHPRIPSVTPSGLLSDSTVLMNLNAAELTHIE